MGERGGRWRSWERKWKQNRMDPSVLHSRRPHMKQEHRWFPPDGYEPRERESMRVRARVWESKSEIEWERASERVRAREHGRVKDILAYQLQHLFNNKLNSRHTNYKLQHPGQLFSRENCSLEGISLDPEWHIIFKALCHMYKTQQCRKVANETKW